MNCDHVFEILTRGPFPAGEPTDAAVELHLARCHDCRQLAEALRPAVELFHETLSAGEEAESLPGYYGALHAAGGRETVLTAAPWLERSTVNEPAPECTRVSLPRVGQAALGMAFGAALCCALALLTVKVSGERLGLQARQRGPNGVWSSSIATGAEVRKTLAALQLPLACFPGEELARPVSLAGIGLEEHATKTQLSDNLLCCTTCHHAQSPSPHVSAVALLQREACVACHRWE